MGWFISNKEQIRVSSKTIFAGPRQVAGELIRVASDPVLSRTKYNYLGCNPLSLKPKIQSMNFGAIPYDLPGGIGQKHSPLPDSPETSGKTSYLLNIIGISCQVIFLH